MVSLSNHLQTMLPGNEFLHIPEELEIVLLRFKKTPQDANLLSGMTKKTDIL
jgi:hypothetical protein